MSESKANIILLSKTPYSPQSPSHNPVTRIGNLKTMIDKIDTLRGPNTVAVIDDNFSSHYWAQHTQRDPHYGSFFQQTGWYTNAYGDSLPEQLSRLFSGLLFVPTIGLNVKSEDLSGLHRLCAILGGFGSENPFDSLANDTELANFLLHGRDGIYGLGEREYIVEVFPDNI